MRAIQIRCLKCGSVFTSSRQRVLHCTCCFADGTYLKSVVTEVAGDAAALHAQVEHLEVPPPEAAL